MTADELDRMNKLMALKIMGWWVQDGFYCPGGPPFANWSPYADLAQAVQCAEAWRAKNPGYWWKLESPMPMSPEWDAELFDVEDSITMRSGALASQAIVRALDQAVKGE